MNNFYREQGQDGNFLVSYPQRNLSDLNELPEIKQAIEDYFMKLKIYQPYLISEDTITQYQVESDLNVNVKLEKFSLKDILEA